MADDAQRVMDMMPAAQRASFREAGWAAIDNKAAGDPTKARKILYSLGDTARNIFGDTYAQTRHEYDRPSKAAVRKPDNQ